MICLVVKGPWLANDDESESESPRAYEFTSLLSSTLCQVILRFESNQCTAERVEKYVEILSERTKGLKRLKIDPEGFSRIGDESMMRLLSLLENFHGLETLSIPDDWVTEETRRAISKLSIYS
jgi:hypothetical protein